MTLGLERLWRLFRHRIQYRRVVILNNKILEGEEADRIGDELSGLSDRMSADLQATTKRVFRK